MKICKQGGCTWEDVAEFERSYNVQFPPDYQEFLVKYNGGETLDTHFYFNRKLESDVVCFYGIGDVEYSVQNATFPEEIELPELLERGLFPIAENMFGDYILMDVKEAPGRVYFCLHDEGFEIYKLTDDFKSFVKKCKTDKIDIADYTESVESRAAGLIARGKGANINERLIQAWKEEIAKYQGKNPETVKLS